MEIVNGIEQDGAVTAYADIDGLTIDNTVIGGDTPAAGTFTTLAITGGFTANLVTKTENHTATASDYTILCNSTGGSFTVTLPAAASHTRRIYHIKKIDSSANTITIDGNSSETVDGGTTAIISIQNESLTIQSNGSNWYIL